MKNNKHPDVLKVLKFILNKAESNEKFSVQSASKSKELNGLNRHQIARIMRDICLDPEDKGSLLRYTTVDDTNTDNISCHWHLNADAYFSYLSYRSIQISMKTLRIAVVAAALTFIALVLDIYVTLK